MDGCRFLIIHGYLPRLSVKFVSGIKVTGPLLRQSRVVAYSGNRRANFCARFHDDHAVVITAFGVFRRRSHYPTPSLTCLPYCVTVTTTSSRMRVFMLLRPSQFCNSVSPGEGTVRGSYNPVLP